MHLIRLPLLFLAFAFLTACTNELRQARGAEVRVVEAPVSELHAAAVAALEQEGLVIHQNRSDELSAKIEAEFADGKDLTILIEYLNEGISEVTMRAGAFGDEARQDRLFTVLRSHL